MTQDSAAVSLISPWPPRYRLLYNARLGVMQAVNVIYLPHPDFPGHPEDVKRTFFSLREALAEADVGFAPERRIHEPFRPPEETLC